MNTKYLGPIDPSQLTNATEQLEWASRSLQYGGLIAFPTETLYGLGCSIFCEQATRRLYAVKKRKTSHPLPIQLAYFDQAQFVVKKVCPIFRLLFDAFLPGPLTLVVERSSRVPSLVVADRPSVAIRFPSHPVAKRLIEMTGCPLAVPSANITGKPGATTPSHVMHDFSGKIEGVVDGGAVKHGIASTVLSLEKPNEPKILRFGAISQREIEQVLGKKVDVEKEAFCGKLGAFFQKLQVRVRLFSSWEEIEIYLRLSKKGKSLILSANPSCPKIYMGKECLSLSITTLYDRLRLAEQKGYFEVLVLCDETVRAQGDLFVHLKQIAHS